MSETKNSTNIEEIITTTTPSGEVEAQLRGKVETPGGSMPVFTLRPLEPGQYDIDSIQAQLDSLIPAEDDVEVFEEEKEEKVSEIIDKQLIKENNESPDDPSNPPS